MSNNCHMTNAGILIPDMPSGLSGMTAEGYPVAGVGVVHFVFGFIPVWVEKMPTVT
jgi:hypothetical protein